MAPSANLQIPISDSPAGPSRHNGSNSSRPVSVSVQSASTTSPSSTSRKQRASHTVVSSTNADEGFSRHRSGRERNDNGAPPYTDVYSHPAAVAYAQAHPKRTIPKFGPYLLLQTLGEGEFGKVKLGLHSQWGEEVAVKLIRRGNIDSAMRMSKVEREIEVLRTLKHPNIVRLYDVIETDKYIGIIIEYASGGELFDHILAHRYLREKDAAKLFSQLISGVWYIHQKKIVHRDLKLENLLLDRNRNVLITDFGFANRFEHRSDDLMQTSCGSPCYAAPELVISEGLYVGSAVDIWSCGVILYAMLAGYLPFDDDPANPDGDNINLLYKYIVNTPLSFPEYISEQARSLLSLMLVPDPAQRASLEDVMAHPWLAGYIRPREDLDGREHSAFGRTVDDLERAALDQHQQKRQAYQRQMRLASAQSAAPSSEKISRSHSHRPENAPSSTNPPPPRSHSQQPNSALLYQTSPEPIQTPVTSNGGHYDNGLLDGDDPFAAPPGMSSEVAENGKGRKVSRPHTVQVEYDGPRDRERGSRREKAPESQDSDYSRRQRVPSQTTPPSTISAGQRSPEKSRRPSVTDKALPPSPFGAHPSEPSSPSRGRERTTSQHTPRGRRPVEPPSITLASPPETPSAHATGDGAQEAEKDRESQTSSKPGHTPTAVAKFFSSEPSSAHGSALLTPNATDKDAESTPISPAQEEKKNKRSSLTVIINRTIKGRKNRMSTTPTSTHDRSMAEAAVTPASPLPPPSSYTEVSSRPADVDDADVGPHGMQASTGKSKKVMQWFRSRSKARDSVNVDPNRSVRYDEDNSLVSGQDDSRYQEGNTSSNTINQQTTSRSASVQVTPSVSRSSRHGAALPQRTPSSATDASSATPSFVARFRNSVTVGGASGHHEKSHSKSPGGILRVHHGAVDQEMVTTRPPPEVIQHIKEVLLGMGIEVQLESEYKYRCIRAKRKKVPGAIATVGGTGSLAAVTLVGSAASNGVDRRGLPVPSHGSFSGGATMLRGLLMRRQSSQVSGASATFDDDPPNSTIVTGEPGSLLEPVYGDTTQDVGDEVRFSVELTRIDRLTDTYSLDIRRLKGNLRSYKFLYDTVRVRAELQR